MQSILHESYKIFDEVLYVTPPISNSYVNAVANEKLTVKTWTKGQRFLQYCSGILSPLKPMFWGNLFKGNISIAAIKHLGQRYFCLDGFIRISEPYIKSYLRSNAEITLLGTWFGVDAHVVAYFKKKYSTVRSMALAHSGEVMPERNPFIDADFHKYIYTHIDKVYFISQKVFNDYLQYRQKDSYHHLVEAKSEVRYLGCFNTSNVMNSSSCDGLFRIVSCSRIDANKRLSTIVEALRKWTRSKIEWSHIGIGNLSELIEQQVKELTEKNPLVKVKLLGRLDNKSVMQYYENNPADVFLNTSLSEGLPISIMEAMSYGIPAIATDVGGSSEIVNAQNGILLDKYFSVDDLLNALSKFYQQSLDEKSRMRLIARQTWKTKFDAKENIPVLFAFE